MANLGRESTRLLLVTSCGFLLALSFARNFVISLAIACVLALSIFISRRHLAHKKDWDLFLVVPEIIDHIISGVQSGLSLNESLISLGSRGPLVARTYFEEFQVVQSEGFSFEEAIAQLQDSFSIRAADQLFEALIFAKNLGGSELLSLLRQLGNFTRQDLALRKEILAKQGWIRNSAHLSAGAPWILLLLLSTQPSASDAFTTPTGVLVLSSGILATTIAYLWMGHLSQMPEPVRVFGRS
jgi:tight adherence protein B